METKEKKTEEKVFNFYLITAAAGAVAVLGVGLVLLIMLLKRKKAKKAALNVADSAADNNESAGETADGGRLFNFYTYKNIAKGESQYGMFNDRDYSTTLRLAREADRYNNKPTEHIMG